MLKLVVDRARPPDPAVDTALGSFPSGHVIHAVVIFGLVPFLLWILTNRRLFLRVGASVLLAAEQLLTSSWATDRCATRGHHPERFAGRPDRQKKA